MLENARKNPNVSMDELHVRASKYGANSAENDLPTPDQIDWKGDREKIIVSIFGERLGHTLLNLFSYAE